MNVTVILPSYNPTEKLLEVIGGLAGEGFSDIIIVDDGSGAHAQGIFDKVRQNPICTVLTHEVNKGKGRGLKTAFAYFTQHRKDSAGVVTTDDDGQHLSADIMRCARLMSQTGAIVLGARDFSIKSVPFRSFIGNKATSTIFKFCCGIALSDTQTGLRAIPAKYIEALLETSGERFEYETNMLIAIKENSLDYQEQKITTVYLDNNAASRFNFFKDSVKIYSVIFKYLICSVLSSVLDIAVFTALNLTLDPFMTDAQRLFVAILLARIISSLFNFMFNRQRVFRSKQPLARSMLKYYLLCSVQMAVSYVCVRSLSELFGMEQSIWQTVSKMVIDTILFFVSFVFQREWVFKKERDDNAGD